MTDKPNLADARRVTEAATEGPWAVPGFGDPLLGPSDVCTEGEPGYRHIICEGAGHDAEFIAASRTLVPALLAAVDAVLAVHEGIKGYNLTDFCGHEHDEGDNRVDYDENGDAYCLDSPTGGVWCSECRDGDGNHDAPWPCPTVRVITAHLDIEPR